MSPVSTQTIWKTTARLSDGREIVYFDESPDTGRAQYQDTRGLPVPAFAPPEIRPDPFTGENVVIAAQRQDRTFLPPADECPLDPSTPGHPTEIPAPSYDVVVFENRFPSLREPHGRCEVVCFTSDHDASFATLTPQRVRTVMEAWVDRTESLARLPEVQQVYCFENRGEEIGVTLHHPHGQVYAFPFVTPRTQQMIDQATAYAERAAGKGNLFDDLVARELEAGIRVVARNEHWAAFVPQAARWPFEVRIFPLQRVPDLPALRNEARDAFGPLYLDVLRRFDGLFGQPAPYIAAWHQAPADAGARDSFAAHLQVFSVRRAAGKLKYLAGTESGMGVWINDIVPEEAARRLREAAQREAAQ
jgi:UDPglucose--hexose-1-phosphate uridylyltransferase